MGLVRNLFAASRHLGVNDIHFHLDSPTDYTFVKGNNGKICGWCFCTHAEIEFMGLEANRKIFSLRYHRQRDDVQKVFSHYAYSSQSGFEAQLLFNSPGEYLFSIIIALKNKTVIKYVPIRNIF